MSVERIETGVPGLDVVLYGGLIPESLYLLKGAPGTGKTTLGLQFLIEGARRGERVLYLGLSETRGQLDALATSFGWSLKGVESHDMRRRGQVNDERSSYTVFNPSDVELEEIFQEIVEQMERVKPTRLVLDSLSEIRLLAEDPFRYRRELLALSDHICARNCTALLIDVEAQGPQDVAETLVSGVVVLQQLSPEYGGDRRRMHVRKLRASKSIGGYHDFGIGEHGVEVFPRLVASQHRAARHASSEVLSGVPELNALLGGGLDRGTSTVLMGPAGVGKSTIAAQFVAQSAERGETSAVFCFDESPTNLLIRCTGLGIPLKKHVDAGLVHLMTVDPAEFSPGELTHRVRTHVKAGARLIVIDSLNGYLSAMPEERFLAAHLHELLTYLSEQGVTTLITLAQHGFFGLAEAPINISYIADTVLLFRYFETAGEVKQAISVVKKRTGRHERSIRELSFRADGVHVGEPLLNFQGVLSGTPQLVEPALAQGSGEHAK